MTVGSMSSRVSTRRFVSAGRRTLIKEMITLSSRDGGIKKGLEERKAYPVKERRNMDVENERNRIHPDICWHGYRKQADSLHNRIRDNMDHPNWFGSLDLNS